MTLSGWHSLDDTLWMTLSGWHSLDDTLWMTLSGWHSLEFSFLFSLGTTLRKFLFGNLMSIPQCNILDIWKLWLPLVIVLHAMQSIIPGKNNNQSVQWHPKFPEIGDHGCWLACGIKLHACRYCPRKNSNQTVQWEVCAIVAVKWWFVQFKK